MFNFFQLGLSSVTIIGTGVAVIILEKTYFIYIGVYETCTKSVQAGTKENKNVL